MHIVFISIILFIVQLPGASIASLKVQIKPEKDVYSENLDEDLNLYKCSISNNIKNIDKFPVLKFLQERKQFFVASHCTVKEESQEEFQQYLYDVFTALLAETVDNQIVISLKRVEDFLTKKAMDIIEQRESAIKESASTTTTTTPTKCPVPNISPQESAVKRSWLERNPKTFACCMIGLGALGFWGLQKLSSLSTLGAAAA